jgi:HEPN domain-containing protein
MNANENNPEGKEKFIIHLGTTVLSGSGFISGGVVKLRRDKKQDLLGSAKDFLKAADRCLNGCKLQKGVEMLIVPGAVCASFACELFIKYIILVDKGEYVYGHPLYDLFKKCGKEIQSALIARRPNIVEIFERNNTQFVDVRYHHEEEIVSFRHQELLQTAELLSKFIEERYPNEKI